MWLEEDRGGADEGCFSWGTVHFPSLLWSNPPHSLTIEEVVVSCCVCCGKPLLVYVELQLVHLSHLVSGFWDKGDSMEVSFAHQPWWLAVYLKAVRSKTVRSVV